MKPGPQPDRSETSGRAFVDAIAHPVRSKIVAILEHKSATAAELSAELGVPARTVRHHLGVLREGGFVSAARRAPRRNVYEYSFVGHAIGIVDDDLYAELNPLERRKVTNHFLRVITLGMSRFVASGSTYDEHFPYTARIPLILDQEGWHALNEICNSTLKQLVDLKARSGERLSSRAEEPHEVEVAIIALEVPRAEP